MKLISDKWRVGFGARDSEGTKLEPEEQPVRREMESQAEVKTTDGAKVATPIPIVVSAEMDAQQAEEILATQCQFCEHWRQDEFRRVLPHYAAIDRDRMRAQALDCASLDDVDLTNEQAARADTILLEVMGRCMANSFQPHFAGGTEPLETHREASCPEGLPLLFKPRPDAKKLRSLVHDRMMRRASGKESS